MHADAIADIRGNNVSTAHAVDVLSCGITVNVTVRQSSEVWTGRVLVFM